MANALVDIIKAGDRDALNAYLLNQQIGGDQSGMSLNSQPNNALTALVRGQTQPQIQPPVQPRVQPSDGMQPLNTIRASSGEYITPSGERSIAPVGFGAQQQPPQFRGTPVDVAGQGKGYMQPDGTIVGINAAGQKFTVNPAGTAAATQAQQDAMLKRQQMQAQIADTLAQTQQRRAAVSGEGVQKPVFNADAGGYVYPPSPENPQGKFVPVSGFSAGGNKPLTEFQGKAALFGSRAAAASDLIDKVGAGEAGAAKTLQYWQDVPLAGRAANVMASPQAQSLAQAQRDFVNAVMRLESGATISPSEFANASQQYFPQPGDSPQVIAQKKNNREMAIEGLSKLAGPSGSEFVKTQRSAAQQPGGLTGAIPHPQDTVAVQWAKANPSDPRAARILQLAGG